MIYDALNLFAKKQTLAAATDGEFIVDLGQGDAGHSEGMSLAVETPPSGGTMQVKLLSSDEVNAAKTALVTPVTVATYDVQADKITAGGCIFASRLPHGMKRYAAVSFTVTGALVGQPVTSGLVWDAQSNH